MVFRLVEALRAGHRRRENQRRTTAAVEQTNPQISELIGPKGKDIQHPVAITKEARTQFSPLAESWEDRLAYEQMTHITGGEDYEAIMKMGGYAVPLVLERMAQGTKKTKYGNTVNLAPWYLALQEITKERLEVPFSGENTYIPGVRFSQFEDERRAWIRWGQEHGYFGEDPQKLS